MATFLEMPKPPEMGVCNNCGAPVPPTAKFCTSCGATIKASPAEEAPKPLEQENLCNRCGSPLRTNAKFCSRCGTPTISSSSEQAAQPPVQEKTPSKEQKAFLQFRERIGSIRSFLETSSDLNQHLNKEISSLIELESRLQALSESTETDLDEKAMDWMNDFYSTVEWIHVRTLYRDNLNDTGILLKNLEQVCKDMDFILERDFGIMRENIQIGTTRYHPSLHEMGLIVPNYKYSPGTITAVTEQGFLSSTNGTRLRKARVWVAKGPEVAE